MSDDLPMSAMPLRLIRPFRIDPVKSGTLRFTGKRPKIPHLQLGIANSVEQRICSYSTVPRCIHFRTNQPLSQ